MSGLNFDWQASRLQTEQVHRMVSNQDRATRRRQLYRDDPIWRLTKLKANWEIRERMRRAGFKQGTVDGRRAWIKAHD